MINFPVLVRFANAFGYQTLNISFALSKQQHPLPQFPLLLLFFLLSSLPLPLHVVVFPQALPLGFFIFIKQSSVSYWLPKVRMVI